MAITTLALSIGQAATLSAAVLDSLSAPVAGVNLQDVIWTIDDPTIATINPTGKLSEITGETVVVTAVGVGAVDLVASFDNGVTVFTQQVIVTVTALNVASIEVTQIA